MRKLLFIVLLFAWGAIAQSNQAGFQVVLIENMNIRACQNLMSILPFVKSCQPTVWVAAAAPVGSAVRFTITYLDVNGNAQTMAQTVGSGTVASTVLTSDGSPGTTTITPASGVSFTAYCLQLNGDFTLKSISGTLMVDFVNSSVIF
jgi:hypothetical protein